jgi:hypothetical protein
LRLRADDEPLPFFAGVALVPDGPLAAAAGFDVDAPFEAVVRFDPVAFDPEAFDAVLFDPEAFDPVAFDPVAFDPEAFDPVAFVAVPAEVVSADARLLPAADRFLSPIGSASPTALIAPPATSPTVPATLPAARPTDLTTFGAIVPRLHTTGRHLGE